MVKIQSRRMNREIFESLKVKALSECLDLIANGYIMQVSCFAFPIGFAKLRHAHNKRCLTLRIDNGILMLKEGTKILKMFL